MMSPERGWVMGQLLPRDWGIWNVYFGPLKLGRLNERHMRIEDDYGRPKRRNV